MSEETRVLPVLPIKNTVLFPFLLMPLSVGRERSLAATEAAAASEDKTLLVVAQKDAGVQDPAFEHLYTIGTEAVIKRLERGEGGVQMIVQGTRRMEIIEQSSSSPYLQARAHALAEPADQGTEIDALQRTIVDLVGRIQAMTQSEAQIGIAQILSQFKDPLHQAYLLASMLSLDLEKEQQLLEATTRLSALRLMHEFLTHEVQIVELRQKIASQAQSEMSREQREYLLRQQLRAIQQELGEQTSEQAEMAELRQRLAEAKLPEDVQKGGRARAGPARAPAAGRPRLPDHAFLRRTDPRAALDRRDRGQPRPVAGPQGTRRRPLRRQGGQRADHRAIGRAQAESRRQGADPLLRRPAGRRQDVARPVDRPGPGPQVRADESGRHARRVGAARASPHLYRRHAGPHPASHPPRRRAQSAADARRSRQSGSRLSGRSDGRSAGDSRPGAELRVSRQLFELAVRLVKDFFRGHGQHARHGASPAVGPHGNLAAGRLQRRREGADRQALSHSARN